MAVVCDRRADPRISGSECEVEEVPKISSFLPPAASNFPHRIAPQLSAVASGNEIGLGES